MSGSGSSAASGGPVQVPPSWQQRAREILSGDLTPVTPRRAATVVLLRDRPAGGPQAYMLRRRSSMSFAAGMYAFPGGSVDPRDADRAIGWAGPPPREWAERLGLTDEPGVPPEEAPAQAQARAIVCAAVRETFEESGVLLAGPGPSSLVADTTGADWERDRAALVGRSLTMSEFLARRGLVLRSDLLGSWSRWITPEFEDKRFDTWFFVAQLPRGQRTRDVSGEADRVAWVRPRQALEQQRVGDIAMLPPTIHTLRGLADAGSAAEALRSAAGREISPVMARPRMDGDRLVVEWSGIPDPFGRG